jgi:hypothetical protein
MDEQKEYVCDACGAVFWNARELEEHKLSHAKDKEEQKKELEQGTQQPTQRPTMPPSAPPNIQTA